MTLLYHFIKHCCVSDATGIVFLLDLVIADDPRRGEQMVQADSPPGVTAACLKTQEKSIDREIPC